MQTHGREPISPHAPVGEDGDSGFGDQIEDPEAIQLGEVVISRCCGSSCI